MEDIDLKCLGKFHVKTRWVKDGLEYVTLVSTDGLPGSIKIPVYMMMDLLKD